jgi:hypothetical protein
LPDVDTGRPFTSITVATSVDPGVTEVAVVTTETKRSQLNALDAPPLLPQSK